jgi:hypothetical protein
VGRYSFTVQLLPLLHHAGLPRRPRNFYRPLASIQPAKLRVSRMSAPRCGPRAAPMASSSPLPHPVQAALLPFVAWAPLVACALEQPSRGPRSRDRRRCPKRCPCFACRTLRPPDNPCVVTLCRLVRRPRTRRPRGPRSGACVQTLVAQVPQDLVDARRLVDQRDHAHLAATARAL